MLKLFIIKLNPILYIHHKLVILSIFFFISCKLLLQMFILLQLIKLEVKLILFGQFIPFRLRVHLSGLLQVLFGFDSFENLIDQEMMIYFLFKRFMDFFQLFLYLFQWVFLLKFHFLLSNCAFLQLFYFLLFNFFHHLTIDQYYDLL